jgi:nucleoside-diphosphate-sugar epimerase
MKVFITGASGHIGSAVVPELLESGHQVIGLARSDASAAALEAAGGVVRRGDLDDLEVLTDAASRADGVIHLAFRHDLVQDGAMGNAVDADGAALQALAEGLEGTGKPLVGTSGTLLLGRLGITGRPGTEDDHVPTVEGSARTNNENFVVSLAERGIRSSVVRLPPLVHSTLDKHGFGPTLISIARANGFAGYPGDGTNHWSAGHTLDAARLYRLALEKAPAGTRLHADGEEGIQLKEIATTIAEMLGVPVKSIPLDQLESYFGFLGAFIALDARVSTAKTQALLGWAPVGPTLIDDLKAGHYFNNGSAAY